MKNIGSKVADAERVIETVVALSFPVKEFAVFGGACLALRHIREARDLEIFISDGVAASVSREPSWQEKTFRGRNKHFFGIVAGLEVQLFSTWDNDGWQPDINSYLTHPEVVEGVPCMPLEELLKWKLATARPKDLRDIRLVEERGLHQ